MFEGPESRINRAQVRKTIESEGVNGIEVMVICLFPGEQIRFGVFSFGPINQ